MRPQDALVIYKKKTKVNKAELELKDANAALKEVAQADPGTPEEWEDLSIADRFDKLWEQLELLLNDAIYRSGIDLEGQTNTRTVVIDDNGRKQNADLSFALSRDAFQTAIIAYWTFETPESDDGPTKHEESFVTHDDLHNLTKNKKQIVEAALNRLYYSAQAYEAVEAPA